MLVLRAAADCLCLRAVNNVCLCCVVFFYAVVQARALNAVLSSPPLAGYAKVSESHSPAAASVLALLNEEESFVIGCCLIYQARASARDSDAGRGSHRERTNYGRLWGGGQTHAHAIQPLGVAACNTDVRRGIKHERTRYSNRGAMFAPRAHKNTTGGRGGGVGL